MHGGQPPLGLLSNFIKTPHAFPLPAGAFNMTTGPLHWELLAKARAVDNQLYVLTCSPARNPDSSYQVRHTSSKRPRGGRSCAVAQCCPRVDMLRDATSALHAHIVSVVRRDERALKSVNGAPVALWVTTTRACTHGHRERFGTRCLHCPSIRPLPRPAKHPHTLA